MHSRNSTLIIALALISVLLSSTSILAVNSGRLQASQGVSMAPLTTSLYLEDFTNDSLADLGVTTASGWGSGLITNDRQYTPSPTSELDFYSIPNKIVDVVVQGRKVYATANNMTSHLNTLYCLNITDPADIEYMSHRDSQRGFLSGDVQGDIYYNGGSQGGGWFGIYNVSQPYNLGGTGVFLNNWLIEGPVTDIQAEGHFVFGTAFNSTISRGLVVFDVEDPYNEVRVDNTLTFDEALGLDIDGSLLYLADGTYGLFVLDVSDPYNIPGAIGSFDTPGNATDVLIDGNFAYIADGPGGIHILDIRDPTTPVLLGSNDQFLGNARRLALQGSTLFVAAESGGVVILDVSVPTHPQVVDYIGNPYYFDSFWDVALYGGILVVGADSGVYTFHPGMGLTSLPVIGTHTGGWTYWDIEVAGDIAYVAAGFAGLMVFNVRDRANPILLNHTSVPGFVFYRALDLYGDILQVCDWNAWIRTYNISDPSYPILMTNWGGSGATDIDVAGGVAYIAAGTNGVQIWNVSNPQMPFVITSLLSGVNVTTTEVQGPHLYVGIDYAGTGPGLQIYDITTIAAPTLTAQFSITSLIYDLDIDGDILHMADGNWYVLWNVTDPFNPFYHIGNGWLDAEPLSNIGVEGFGPYCLSTNGSKGVALVDGRNINFISYMGGAPSVTFARGITIHGDYAYIATNHSFEIIHLERSAASTYQTGSVIVQSLNVADTTNRIVNATLDFGAYVPTGTSVTFELSADGGLNWETVTPGVQLTFTTPGQDLRWRATLTTNRVDASIHLYNVSISYDHIFVPFTLPPLPWLYIILAIVMVLIIVVLVVVLRRRRRK